VYLAALLLTLTLLAQGTTVHVVNGTVVYLPEGPVVVMYPAGQKVAIFNVTQGKWAFRVYEEGPIVITLASSGVGGELRSAVNYVYGRPCARGATRPQLRAARYTRGHLLIGS